jgi:hypothetical protein
LVSNHHATWYNNPENHKFNKLPYSGHMKWSCHWIKSHHEFGWLSFSYLMMMFHGMEWDGENGNEWWRGKDLEGDSCGLSEGTTPAFSWRGWETTQKLHAQELIYAPLYRQSMFWLARLQIWGPLWISFIFLQIYCCISLDK